MVTVAEELDKAVQGAFTRPVPKTAGAQMRYLVKQHQRSTQRVAELLGISQRTVERYVKNQIKTPRPELARRLAHEVRTRWQPQIRARAKEAAATTSGIMIDVQARFGYTAAPGSTDQARVRHLTLALPPHHAARLLQAQEAGVDEDQLRQLAAEALGEVYFRDNGRRAHGLEVKLTDVLDLQFEL
ncbi:helix-turn-helix transcriptional regulator [Streptomyces scabiei]|uniref:telomere-protecting terminal protein Tpg n=1 Tax=Streptomyces scabiei TaxID=1930 RepID=UPI001B306B0B|nr:MULTISPECIES: helix-turn-helix transcriptional regulator [Streptomyces]MBP5859158.1 helix-turn-helix transcriptional regulator [Streptomyces sp. LBUM 1484]MBP5866059.1 helix-turn-helix transcriptional regulator [Streptomyces sp. LBUM 1484]MBP5880867.1 helix-turn-helix transcriptional regulator [Streptomyces sp. LBUM 1487]MBP5888624.1 helix-turn-helix transcriptional regulator [Streptomyces sp. LBUM 1487]MBP5896623.1 helix-turn-helix transcriptional regulator [Streptomyces sp. LBUM 1488]